MIDSGTACSVGFVLRMENNGVHGVWRGPGGVEFVAHSVPAQGILRAARCFQPLNTAVFSTGAQQYLEFIAADSSSWDGALPRKLRNVRNTGGGRGRFAEPRWFPAEFAKGTGLIYTVQTGLIRVGFALPGVGSVVAASGFFLLTFVHTPKAIQIPGALVQPASPQTVGVEPAAPLTAGGQGISLSVAGEHQGVLAGPLCG